MKSRVGVETAVVAEAVSLTYRAPLRVDERRVLEGLADYGHE